ncbi:hypothetical protein CDO09_21215 [Xanthomonas perforans]|nr:hypothetical protein CDO09_21215 [Xanthomonas perforans]
MPVPTTNIQFWHLITDCTLLGIFRAHAFKIVANNIFLTFSTYYRLPISGNNFFSKIAVRHTFFKTARKLLDIN